MHTAYQRFYSVCAGTPEVGSPRNRWQSPNPSRGAKLHLRPLKVKFKTLPRQTSTNRWFTLARNINKKSWEIPYGPRLGQGTNVHGGVSFDATQRDFGQFSLEKSDHECRLLFAEVGSLDERGLVHSVAGRDDDQPFAIVLHLDLSHRDNLHVVDTGVYTTVG